MNSIRMTLAAAVFGLMVVREAGAQAILTYDISSVANPNTVPVGSTVSGLSASAITLGPALSTSSFWDGTTGLFGATNLPAGSSPGSNAYFQFSVSADLGKRISFGTLT